MSYNSTASLEDGSPNNIQPPLAGEALAEGSFTGTYEPQTSIGELDVPINPPELPVETASRHSVRSVQDSGEPVDMTAEEVEAHDNQQEISVVPIDDANDTVLTVHPEHTAEMVEPQISENTENEDSQVATESVVAGDVTVPDNDGPKPTETLDTSNIAVHPITEEAIHSLDAEKESIPVESEEVVLLNERLKLDSSLPLEVIHAPLEHSTSTIPIPSSSPRQELDEQASNPMVLIEDSNALVQPLLQPPEVAATSPDSHSDSTQGPPPSTPPAQDEEKISMPQAEGDVNAPDDTPSSQDALKQSPSDQPILLAKSHTETVSESPSHIHIYASNIIEAPNKIYGDDARESSGDTLPADQEITLPPSMWRPMGGAATPFAQQSISMQPNDPFAAPMSAPILIVQYDSEGQDRAKEPMIIDIRDGSPLPEPSIKVDTPSVSTSRSPLDRTTSTVPEPPTSPQSELEPEVQTPKLGPTQTHFLSAKTLPAVEDHTLDFVEEARSERSVAASVAPIAPSSPRFITPIPTPLSDVDGFAFYEQGGLSGNPLNASSSLPLTEEVVKNLPEADDIVKELAPELKDALDTSFQDNDAFQNIVRSNRGSQSGLVTSALPPAVNAQASSSRPRPVGHVSSPSTWSIQRASGWFNTSPEKPQGEPSMEVAEGEFSRPVSRVPRSEYPPDPRAAANSPSSPSKKDEGRCIIM
ncbi:hypothetical protein M408DRAFT_326118 [Serendipita vermifera MAFF 305830]|uniref:Uncharacterized protein n=1 Tax=Serendipita vermifera MAFF 305830 TaxID=933852 RepID=A0A0C3BMQ7_SERVB|nr:hypothetical protein M408DRAFT_326118 [Serendipita vermifera MAFF 305830]